MSITPLYIIAQLNNFNTLRCGIRPAIHVITIDEHVPDVGTHSNLSAASTIDRRNIILQCATSITYNNGGPMKLELVKCNEVVDGKKVFVAEGNLQIAESLEDIILMTESGECPEATLVVLFNASRRIRLQANLKNGGSDKPTAKATLAKIEAAALNNPELTALLASFKMVPNGK